MNNYEKHYVTCSCLSSEHVARFMYDKDEKELYLEVQLVQPRTFVQRIGIALKYILGYNSKYGHWDCTMIDKSEANRLYQFLKRYKDILND